MRLNSSIGQPFTRFAIWLATTSLTLTTPLGAIAQPSPPPGANAPAEDVAGQPNTDPPQVAGSLASVAGSVSFHAAGETQWSPATLNYPVTNGEGFWTEPQASATIDVAGSRIVMDESTEFDVTTLDQSQFVATEAQGAIYVQLNNLSQGQSLVVNTPRGSVQISQSGQYEIVAGDTNDATAITVVQGAAHISGTSLNLDVGPNQTATITGSDTVQGTVGSLQEDAFLKAQLQLVSQQQHANVPQVCQYMTGGEQLASYGSFTQTQQYGQVWYPHDVPSDWAPYRDGHWAYVSPWGWTWVDNARWGFAPFHYGRWAQIEGRWGWIPGGGGTYVPGAYPIYSPALVSFVGVGAIGLGFSLGIGAGGYAPAWIPLGPREPYYPWYHVREGYFDRINSFYGVPRNIIERGPTYINTINIHQNNFFINRSAATVISANAFARGQSVMTAGHPLPERAFQDARPLGGRLAVRPTAFTPNLPPAAAHRFNLPIAAHPVHVAAGPRIEPIAPGTRAVPELRRAALPQNVHAAPAEAHPDVATRRPGEAIARPGEAARPGESALHSGEPPRSGLPALRPGEVARPGETALRPGDASRPSAASAAHGLPALREPGAHPEDVRRPAEAGSRYPSAAGRQAASSLNGVHPEPARPGLARPEVARPEIARPGAARPEVTRPEPARPQPNRPGAELRPDTRPAPRPEALSRTETHAPMRSEPRPATHEAAPRAARPEAARPEPARALPRPEEKQAPRPEQHAEAPRPQPRAEPSRPAPHPAARPEEKHPGHNR